MSAASLQVIRWGDERARTGPWRGDGRVAHMAPLADGRPLSAGFVRHCADRLTRLGYDRVITAALSPLEQTGFLEAGFEVEQRLHLLAHDLSDLPTAPHPPGITLRRFRSADMGAVIAVDADAFDAFWTMDRAGIEEAVSATPRSRFRVASGDADTRGPGGRVPDNIVGYAVTGRAARRGYLQRLAVTGARSGQGIGQELVVDGLRWLRHWRAERCLVNTQVGNNRALDLYRRLGFVPEPSGLAVLGMALTP